MDVFAQFSTGDQGETSGSQLDVVWPYATSSFEGSFTCL